MTPTYFGPRQMFFKTYYSLCPAFILIITDLDVRELGDVIEGRELEVGLAVEVRHAALPGRAVRHPAPRPAPARVLVSAVDVGCLGQPEVVVVVAAADEAEVVVVDLIEHEVRHLRGVRALGPGVGGGAVALGLALVLDADPLKHIMQRKLVAYFININPTQQLHSLQKQVYFCFDKYQIYQFTMRVGG